MQAHAVLMAGGSGTRFWPASRPERPKQFLPIGTDEPLLVETARRIRDLIPPERTWVVTAAEHAGLVRELLPELPAAHVLAEPVGRNTLPCVALATVAIEREDPGAVQVVLPADHVVDPPEALRAVLAAAVEEAADSRALCTLGIEPSFPATGYGWIECGAQLPARAGHAVHAVTRFHEKPDLATAERYLAAGGFLWNGGVFVWSSAAIRAALERFAPATWSALEAVDPTDARALAAAYAGLESVPVDVGVLERAADVRVLPVAFRWNDVGTWSSIPDVVRPDAAGNFVQGGAEVRATNATGNVVHAAGRVTLSGVHDLVVVRTDEAVLVTRRDRAQDVREVVARVQAGSDGVLLIDAEAERVEPGDVGIVALLGVRGLEVRVTPDELIVRGEGARS